MKSLAHHVNTVKAQPHHVRKQVAFATAFIVAAFIALVWAGASFATDAFAIKGSSFADASGAETTNVAAGGSNTSLTASAAEAGQGAGKAPGIQIVDGQSASASAPSQPTTIPF